MTPAMRAKPTIPAMTPPTIAPTLVLEPPELDAGSVEIADGVDVAEGPAAVDSGAPESAMSCAAVELKLSGVWTSRYAQAGTDVPDGMGLG